LPLDAFTHHKFSLFLVLYVLICLSRSLCHVVFFTTHTRCKKGAAISTSLTMGASYCCMSAIGSVCNACLGSTAAGTTGRKRSVLLLTLAVVLALWFQYAVGPAIVTQKGALWKTYRFIPGMGSMVYGAWSKECLQYYDKKDTTLLEQCAGRAGVMRPMAIATLFFAIMAIATNVQPRLNRELWPAKYTIFGFAVFFSLFISSGPLFTGLYLWLARLGATLFVVLQQVILIDVAYNWNDDWVDRADQADRLVYGAGNAWLRAIVGTCAALYGATLVGIVLLYQYFDGCAGNVWIITLTLLAVIAITTIQLLGSEGSLLTSSIISLYIVYLAYSMVSKNPHRTCNPQLGENDVTGMAIGLTLTAISLAWTGWSWTAEDRLNVDGIQSARTVTSSSGASTPLSSQHVNLDVPFLDPGSAPTSGLVMNSGHDNDGDDDDVFDRRSIAGSQVWKLNVVMALICCWVAMTLTGWGTLQSAASGDNNSDGNDHSYQAANPTVGRFNMAMLGISQWCVILLYVWTLTAPILFPDRDFS
jgi:serine incorporator 1/3